MQQMIASFWLSRAIHSAAKFGLADLLRNGPKTVDELAAESGTHAPSLYRLLRALASAGVFEEQEDGRFRSTPLAATLDSQSPGSMRYFAMAELGQEHYSAWEEFPHSIATGEMAFTKRYPQYAGGPWKYYAEHPDHAEVFNNSMTKLTEYVNSSVGAIYDFSRFRKIVDIGGGHGGLLAAMLNANPNARGILFDSPQVIAGAHGLTGMAERVELQGGDFFQSVPAGGDLYTLKWILHDWTDEQCAVILKNIRKAITRDGTLLIVECVIPPLNTPSFGKLIDLNMMVMTGGRERTEEEFAALFKASGFTLHRVIPTETGMSVIEAK